MTNLQAYRPYWHPIALAADVTEVPRRFTLLGENLVAWRSHGQAVVMKDLCIHRGSALSLGTVREGTIECAYHGWRYDGAGKCVSIPSLPAGKPIPAKAAAITYEAREYAGLIWTALAPAVAPFPHWPQGCEYDNPALRSHVVDQYYWEVGAGRAIENFLDVAHFPFIHENTLGTRDDTVVHEHDIDRGEFGISYTYLQEEPADLNTGVGEKVELEYHYKVPLTAHLKRSNPHGEWTCVSLLASPTTPTTSTLFVTCTRNFALEPEADAGLSEFIGTVMNQDKAIVQSVRPEEIPVELSEELHLKVPDAAGLLLRRYLAKVEGSDTRVA